jgi:hypothetical protein
MCPWCCEDNTEYKRLMELKEHGKRDHPLETRKHVLISNIKFNDNY